MDAESLAQVERIVTTAVSGAEGRLRNEMQGLGASLRQETGALAISLREELAEKFEEAERHAGALFEETLHRIDLVVEGHQSLRAQISDLDQKIDHVSVELQSLMKLSYRQLHDRVETLEQRVMLIEKRLGLAN